jgi:segregation and condensation protein B
MDVENQNAAHVTAEEENQPGAAADEQAASGASAPNADGQTAAPSNNDVPGADQAVPSGEDAPPEASASSADDFLAIEPAATSTEAEDVRLKAVIEAIIYVTDEPLTLDQISAALEHPRDRVGQLLEQLAAEYEQPDRGLSVREVAGGYKLSTKPEHHDAVRRFVKNLKPALKLSLAALETLAVIAYKQPITAPEIMEIRGVQGAGVLKTLLDRKVIAAAGRKNVVGKPILYKTTREFLVQFGLKDLSELPTLKEFQEIGRLDMETPDAQKGTTSPETTAMTAVSPQSEPPDSPPPSEKDPPAAEPSEGDPPAAEPAREDPPAEPEPDGPAQPVESQQVE